MKALVLAAFIAAPAVAQDACIDRAAILKNLSDKYDEQPRLGALSNDLVIEFFGNAETGTWTLLATGSGGVACVIAAGVGFSVIAPGDLM